VRASFERHGLIPNGSVSATLGDLIRLHEPSIQDKKFLTRQKYMEWYREMEKFFGSDRSLGEIGKTDAERMRSWCLSKRFRKLSTATVARGVRMCRTIFQFGVDSGLMLRNPFYKVKCGSDVNVQRQEYVERSRVMRVVEACSSEEDRFVLLLARFAGLRIPSEIRYMKFGDFTGDRFSVHPDTKTGPREVPFFEELRESFERLRKGRLKEDLIFPCNYAEMRGYRPRILRSMVTIGEKGWEKLFVNLRSSCITDFVMLGCNDKTLDSIFGNSSFVRFRHYVQFLKEYEMDRLLRDNLAIVRMLKEHGGKSDDIRELEYRTRLILAENAHKEILVKLFGQENLE
jgi:hypothetical protein